MEASFKVSRLSQALGLLFALSATAAFAQVRPPNAGSLMKTPVAPVAAPAKSPALEVQQKTSPAPVNPGGVKVKVASFKISGNTVFDEATLKALLNNLIGEELDHAGLDQAAGTISQYYRQRGYFVARAYLLTQEITSGHLEIAVIEGTLGAIKFTRSGKTRLSESRSQGLVAAAAPVGSPIREQNIERGLMLLNDLPGVEVKSTLVPGATPKTSDLVIETTEGALVRGSVDLDNYGNKYTGTERVGATLNLNDPAGMGDQLVMRAMTSGTGMRYGRLAYNLPVGDMGTKLGMAYARMNYELGGDFTALKASGESAVVSLFAVQPVIRSRNNNLNVTASYDNKRLSDVQNSVNVSRKTADVYALGLSGDLRDGYGGGGLSAASLTVTGGNLDVGGNANYAANDALAARTEGSYSKLSYSLLRLQHINDSWSFYAGLSGQAASKNLDSSEKFVLGGMGVRAYPQGEAAGDSGNLINLEARYNVPGFNFANLQVVGFVDTGRITLNNTPWGGSQPIGRPNFPNTYSLSGAGIGLNLYKKASFSVNSSVAWKLGSNAGADVIGRDSDGGSRGWRSWIQLVKQF